jgi:2-oxoglutarate ferredoxin oxidoreductase subunit gamma
MLLGKVIALAALKENKQVTWMPSYGAAIRGGCAFCMVIISDREIASPYVDKCDTLFVFNQPSWDKFKSRVRKGGSVFLNSSLISAGEKGLPVKIHKTGFTQAAVSLGDARVANMVALGAFLKEKNILQHKNVLAVLSEIAPKDKVHLLEINRKALDKGREIY